MLGLHQPGWARRLVFVAITALAVVAFDALPAGAVLRTGPNPSHRLALGANSQLALTATGPGQSVHGLHSQRGKHLRPDQRLPNNNPAPEFFGQG